MDFVEQLWFCGDHHKTAETFLEHPWLKGKRGPHDISGYRNYEIVRISWNLME